jgi:SAM-dependent methyltransferase
MNHKRSVEPWLFHLHHLHQIEDIPFWLDLAGSLNGPILELGCGTGRVLVPLLQAGHELVGLDVDLAMLNYLKAHLEPRFASCADLVQGDLAAYHFSKNFGLIFLACNTLSMLPIETRRNAFSIINSHLSSDGLFAASIPNPLLLSSLSDSVEAELEETFFHPKTGNPLQVSSEWQRLDRRTLNFRWHYDHLLPDGRVERSSVEVEHTITRLDEYKSELRAAGLSIEASYGDFHRSAYNAESPYLIIFAKKTA